MFNEENSVEPMVLNTLRGGVTSNMVAEELACFWWESMPW
jgi:type I restriction enzyme R subunit